MNNTVCSLTYSDVNMFEGVHSDIQTVIALGATPCHVNSAISVQDVLMEGVSDKIFSAQLDSLFVKNTPAVLKVGFLASREQVQLLCKKNTRS